MNASRPGEDTGRPIKLLVQPGVFSSPEEAADELFRAMQRFGIAPASQDHETSA